MTRSDAGAAANLVRVEVIRPHRGGLQRSTTQNGTISAFEFSALFAKVSGYLGSLNVDIGDHVKAGQELAVIDVPELAKAVEQARAALEVMHAQKKQAEARLKSAGAGVDSARSRVARARSELERTTAQRVYRKKALDRIQELAGRDSVERRLVDEEEDRYHVSLADEHAAVAGVQAAEALLAEARARVELAQADVEDADANIRAAEADLGKARVLAEYTHIRSPYDGVITQRGYHRGDFIRSAADGTGIPLLTVARTDLMRVIVQVPERDEPFLDAGDPATLRIDALGGRVFTGKVSRFAEAEDPRDRTMRAEIDLPNPDGVLVGGMYGYATIVLEPATANLTIPSSTLVEHGRDSRSALFVVRDGKAHRQEIRIGRDNGIEVEVLEGLTADDLVIDRGVGSVSEGLVIRYQRPPATTAEGEAKS